MAVKVLLFPTTGAAEEPELHHCLIRLAARRTVLKQERKILAHLRSNISIV
jgi:hypothetical protein